MDKSFLLKKGHRYYVRLMVPKALQSRVGKTRLVRSLETGDLATANTRKHRVLAELHGELAAATALPSPNEDTPADVLASAREYRQRVASDEVSAEEAEEQVGLQLEALLERAGKTYGVDPDTGHPELPSGPLRVVRAAYRAVRGEPTLFLDEAIEAYLSEKARHLRVQTVNEKRRLLERFSAWLGEGTEARDVTRKRAGDYLAALIRAPKERGGAEGDVKSPRTVADDFAHISGFFSWLVQRGQLDSNPCANMVGTVKASTRGNVRDKKRPFSHEELLVILQGLPKEDPMWSLCALGLYTGMRQDEVANLRASDVAADALRVREGKSKAAIRSVPIHPVIAPLVQQLAATTDDGYLLPGLLAGGEDLKRGKLLGKRFLDWLRNKLEITDPLVDFHSFRRSFMTSCEEAGVPESTVKLIVGHQRQSLTYGGYSGGVSDKVLSKAMASVTYGAEVDVLVKKAGKRMFVTLRPTRRKASK